MCRRVYVNTDVIAIWECLLGSVADLLGVILPFNDTIVHGTQTNLAN